MNKLHKILLAVFLCLAIPFAAAANEAVSLTHLRDIYKVIHPGAPDTYSLSHDQLTAKIKSGVSSLRVLTKYQIPLLHRVYRLIPAQPIGAERIFTELNFKSSDIARIKNWTPNRSLPSRRVERTTGAWNPESLWNFATPGQNRRGNVGAVAQHFQSPSHVASHASTTSAPIMTDMMFARAFNVAALQDQAIGPRKLTGSERDFKDLSALMATHKDTVYERHSALKLLRGSGATLQQFVKAGADFQLLILLGYSGSEIRAAGFDAIEFARAKMGLSFMQSAGFPITDITAAQEQVKAEEIQAEAERQRKEAEAEAKAAAEARPKAVADAQAELADIDTRMKGMSGLVWVSNGDTTTPEACKHGILKIVDSKDTDPQLQNNYLCGVITKQMTWMDNGHDVSKRCARYNETALETGTWANNYLCVPFDFDFKIMFSLDSEISFPNGDGACISIAPGRYGFDDNYMCWRRNANFARDSRNRLVDQAIVAGVPDADTLRDLALSEWPKNSLGAFLKTMNDKSVFKLYDRSGHADQQAILSHLTQLQKDELIEANRLVLNWYQDGAKNGEFCTYIYEGGGAWNNTFLCANKDVGFRWSNNGRIPGMKCFQYFETGAGWDDNFLCVPPSFEYDMRFVPNSTDIHGIQDHCLYIKNSKAGPRFEDNWLCYDRDSLVDLNGRWEPATPPCPTCPEIDYEVSFGVEKGQEKSQESSFGMEVSISVEEDIGAVVEETSVTATTSFSSSFSSAVSHSFSRSKDETISVPCHLGAVWQWVTTAERECSFGRDCPALTARSSIIQCTVPGDEPDPSPLWSPCEPVFNDNQSSTRMRGQNVNSRSDLPGGWRCRGENEILIDQATYGRSCGAERGNVTDVVALDCQDSDTGICTFVIDKMRLGHNGSEQCENNFEVAFTCPGDGDRLRSVRVDNEAGHKTPIRLDCGPGGQFRVNVEPNEPTPDALQKADARAKSEAAKAAVEMAKAKAAIEVAKAEVEAAHAMAQAAKAQIDAAKAMAEAAKQPQIATRETPPSATFSTAKLPYCILPLQCAPQAQSSLAPLQTQPQGQPWGQPETFEQPAAPQQDWNQSPPPENGWGQPQGHNTWSEPQPEQHGANEAPPSWGTPAPEAGQTQAFVQPPQASWGAPQETYESPVTYPEGGYGENSEPGLVPQQEPWDQAVGPPPEYIEGETILNPYDEQAMGGEYQPEYDETLPAPFDQDEQFIERAYPADGEFEQEIFVEDQQPYQTQDVTGPGWETEQGQIQLPENDEK